MNSCSALRLLSSPSTGAAGPAELPAPHDHHVLANLVVLEARHVAHPNGRPRHVLDAAGVVVDEVVFRARNHQVVVLRSCAECGITRFESAPLFSRADLGYALGAWQPHCRSCQPEDPANWLESEAQSIV